MGPVGFSVCLILAISGTAVSACHARSIVRGAFDNVKDAHFFGEGLLCWLFCLATIIYLTATPRPALVLGMTLFGLTLTYMIVGTFYVTSVRETPCDERCDFCQRTHTQPIKPTIGWLLLAFHGLRFFALLALLIAAFF